MNLLDPNSYSKVIAPLSKVPFNNLFARSVVEGKIKGKVFVDDVEEPKTFYVIHPYGMSLLFGASDDQEFNKSFREHALTTKKERNAYEWMQAVPDNWTSVLNDLFKDCLVKSKDNVNKQEGGIVELNTRVNFKFSLEKFRVRKAEASPGTKIVRTDAQIFRDIKGSVVPFYFWNSAEDFLKNGVGFSLFYKDQLAATAYAGFIHGHQLEMGIETAEEFRGKGFAEQVCAALINYCIEHNYEPVWACRLENIGSYKLAQKLGFVPSLEIPYYRLSK